MSAAGEVIQYGGAKPPGRSYLWALRRALAREPLRLPSDEELLADLHAVYGRRAAHERACVALGACPDCGSPEWLPRDKGQLVLTCARCGAHFTTERQA